MLDTVSFCPGYFSTLAANIAIVLLRTHTFSILYMSVSPFHVPVKVFRLDHE